jgi:XrtN system VIT domain protein
MKYNPQVRLAGWVLLLVSLGFYLALANQADGQFVDLPSLFIANMVIAVVYFLVMYIDHLRLNGRQKFFSPPAETYTLSLVLFSLSAHSLNVSGLRVFEPYVDWMGVLVIGMHLVVLALPYQKRIPEFLRYVLYAVSGAGMLVALHLSIFTVPISWLGVVFFWVFGIPTHILVPIWFFAFYLRTFLRSTRENELPYTRAAWWTGVIIPFVALSAVLGKWSQVQTAIETVNTSYHQEADPLYPEWVYLAQRIPEGKLAEYIFMAETFSQKSFWEENWQRLGWGWTGFRYHDPLSFWARALYGDLPMEWETRWRTLEARYDARHMTHRRLWAGDDLTTASVETRLQLFPEYRLAYMEKELTIHNASQRDWEQQEAVYSFYLPDGAVATSLSLWIEGEERLSRLTTRSKADSAYESIVGVERRDPALMHWQEGNRLSVTVFPCTSTEDRRFKIGLTLPMQYAEGLLFLQNVPFDGPSAEYVEEAVQISWGQTEPAELDLPFSFSRKENTYTYEGDYRPNWQLSCVAPALSKEAFAFQDFRYQAIEPEPKMHAFEPETVILDLNAAWTWFELQAVWEEVKDKPVFVLNPHLQAVNEDNLQGLFQDMGERYFSLLPLYQLENPAQTLVISKGVANSPFLSDLDETPFANKSRDWLLNLEKGLHWWELPGETSPYTETLSRLRLLQYASGEVEVLGQLLRAGNWPDLAEGEDQIWIPAAQMSIKRDTLAAFSSTPYTPASGGDSPVRIEDFPPLAGAQGVESINSSMAPDHLYRLFAFQDLMNSMGKEFFDRETLEETWIRKAEAAYIVSPVSSLVVLETERDYKRFGIEENENTLGNAAIEGSGGVPEPHEWAFLLLLVVLIGYFYRRHGWKLRWKA